MTGRKRLVVLGCGTAGTVIVNRLRNRLGPEWEIVAVDRDDRHVYQPGLLFLPFGIYGERRLSRRRSAYVRDGVELVLDPVEGVDPDANEVVLVDGSRLGYDYLVIATGTSPRPDQTPGMAGDEWQRTVFDFYTLPGAAALRRKLASWRGGRLVVHVTEMPIKCPVAPLEFAFLADAFFTRRGMREAVTISYVTPLDGAFTKPIASQRLGTMLESRGIAVTPDFVVDRVDEDRRALVSMDEREVPFDLLVTVPLNMGASFVGQSGLGDELNHVPVDRHTLLSRKYDNVFAVGDAADIPTSKAGSVAHFAAELFVENFLQHIAGLPMTHLFDGHANCFVETGHGKAMLLDFNYDTEPLPGRYPLPRVGPFRLLEESPANHLGKLAFRWAYWHLLLPGRPVPVPALMSMAGKQVPVPDASPTRS